MAPKNSWAGQYPAECHGPTIPLTNIVHGNDPAGCTHQHYQVVLLSDTSTSEDAALDEGQFEQSMSMPVGWAVPQGGGDKMVAQ